jgi:glutathione S-transferase
MRMALKLILANKAYSSWSFRPWILLRHFDIPFEEVVIPLDLPETREAILRFSPSARCPSLQDGEIHVWDSLAIVEYVAESFPQKPIWPADKAARAMARSISSEMHSGFQSLRSQCPTNFRRAPRPISLSAETGADVARIEAAWAHARRQFAGDRPFLFGEFSAADAMFAPVVNRFHAYAIEVSPATRAYMHAVMGLPAWQQWSQEGSQEPWFIEKYEAIP